MLIHCSAFCWRLTYLHSLGFPWKLKLNNFSRAPTPQLPLVQSTYWVWATWIGMKVGIFYRKDWVVIVYLTLNWINKINEVSSCFFPPQIFKTEWAAYLKWHALWESLETDRGTELSQIHEKSEGMESNPEDWVHNQPHALQSGVRVQSQQFLLLGFNSRIWSLEVWS